MKRCPQCKQIKPFSQFHKNSTRRDGYSPDCKVCKNKDSRQHKRRLIQTVMDYYGNKCACCGEAEPFFLTIDHIDGNGAKHKREFFRSVRVSPSQFCRWLIRNEYPDGFQILCHNCNCGKARNNNECPHKAGWPPL